jgi:hypothetical protein
VKKVSLLLEILAIAILCAPLGAQTTPPTCKVGADPVDPTYKWVPPADWKLVKTGKPELVTQTGGHSESICVLPAGQVIAYPPNGGNPIVVLCKNEITRGRPEGTEIPRNQLYPYVTAALAVSGIPTDISISVDGTVNVNVHHDGELKLIQSGQFDWQPYMAPKPKHGHHGLIIAVAVVAGTAVAIVFATHGHGKSSSGTPPGGVTGPTF